MRLTCGPTSPTCKFPDLPQADGYHIEGDQITVFQQIVDHNEVVGTVYLRARYELIDRLFSYVTILGAVMALSLFGAMLITAWLPEHVSRPILEITEVARQVMARRDFSLRVRQHDRGRDRLPGRRLQRHAGRNRPPRAGARGIEPHARSRKWRSGAAPKKRCSPPIGAKTSSSRRSRTSCAIRWRRMRTALELLRLTGSDADALRSAREMMERQLRQLVRLVNDLLDISRITTGKMTLEKGAHRVGATSSRSAVEAARPLIETREHRLNVVLPPTPVTCSPIPRGSRRSS